MSLSVIKEAIAQGKMICPTCNKPVKKFEKYVDMVDSIWDGAGDSATSHKGSKVTLICDNDGCDWKERTEYWANYVAD
ncbi:MAG: hypothetical protein JSS86_14460 [Cyanobacteria bacterium SZAS LIN-2]|nr:hypothetical protein [Cyanobacteria bacterium SZAS LIN-3]MBS1997519.1 hypothetical protein [Cyanobacteria bacterium SZAS LIN-2]MBS2008671.1 hypothetical protein [Cyanobacteria bacterium SZAS TMP-1]